MYSQCCDPILATHFYRNASNAMVLDGPHTVSFQIVDDSTILRNTTSLVTLLVNNCLVEQASHTRLTHYPLPNCVSATPEQESLAERSRDNKASMKHAYFLRIQYPGTMQSIAMVSANIRNDRNPILGADALFQHMEG